MPPMHKLFLAAALALPLASFGCSSDGMSPSDSKGGGKTDDLGGGDSSVKTVDIAVSGASACGLRTDGHVYCWGVSSHNQLGYQTPDLVKPVDPVPELDDAIAISAQSLGFCAVRSGGTVLCWGSETELSPSEPRNTTVANLDSVVAQTGDCALRADGQVLCWPVGSRLGAYKAQAIEGLDDVEQLVVGTNDSYACGIKSDDLLYCWDGTSTEVVPDLGPVEQASGDFRSTCAQRTNGHVVCWGDIYTGIIGKNADKSHEVEGVDNTVKLTLNTKEACALLDDGGVKCWGSPAIVGNAPDAPVEVTGLSDVDHIRINTYGTDYDDHTDCAVEKDGDVMRRGKNTAFPLWGNLDITTAREPVRVEAFDEL